LQPHQTGLKVRCRSAVASAPNLFCPESLRGCITLMLAGRKLARRAETRRAKAGLPRRSRRRRLVLVAGFAPALATLSTSCLCWLGYTSGIWSPHPELHRTDSHTKGVHHSKCFRGMKMVSPAGWTSQVLRVRCPNGNVRCRELQSHRQPDA